QFIIAAQPALDLMLIEQERAGRIERRVTQLLFSQWAAAPITALLAFVELDAEMRFRLRLQRAAPFTASPRREHCVVNRRSRNAKVTRDPHRIINRVMNRFGRRAQFQRLAQWFEIQTGERIYHRDARLSIFAESELQERYALSFAIPPVDGFNIKGD